MTLVRLPTRICLMQASKAMKCYEAKEWSLKCGEVEHTVDDDIDHIRLYRTFD